MTASASPSASSTSAAIREWLGQMPGVTVLSVGRGKRGRLPDLSSGSDLVVLAIDRGTGRPVSARAATRAREERSRLARARVHFAGFELDLIERTLIAPGGGIAQLPGLEFALLKVFLSHPRRPLRRVEMSRMLTRRGDVPLSGRSVDSYVSRLRRRLRHGGAVSLIATWPGIGYSFDADIVRTRTVHGACNAGHL